MTTIIKRKTGRAIRKTRRLARKMNLPADFDKEIVYVVRDFVRRLENPVNAK
jgi:hypothetical protein